ncbi:developmental regulatory protein WetA [Diplocarpon rosae]|nr:developmental regulatory protein WetA [Diplocarpon rosae]
MSFSAVAYHWNNKGADMFVQGCEELGADFFDQFLTYSSEHSETSNYSAIPASSLAQPTGYRSADASLSSTDDETTHAMANDAGRGDFLTAEDHDGAWLHSASGDQFYELAGRAAISDSELLSLEGIFLGSPQIHAASQRSLPSSPTTGPAYHLLRRKNRMVGSLSQTFQKTSASLDKSLLRSPIRKQKSTPKMMGAAHQNSSRSNLDLRGQKLAVESAKFNYDLAQTDAPLSPPPSSRVPDVAQLASSLDPQNGEQLDGVTYRRTLTQQQRMVRPTAYDTPLSTPTLDRHPPRRTSQHARAESALFPTTPQAQHASGSWPQVPGSPGFTSYGASPVDPEIESPLWWNHAATAPIAQPSPINFHNPRRASKSLAMQLQNDLAYHSSDMDFNTSSVGGGLMIQLPDTCAPQSVVLGAPPRHPQGDVHGPRAQPQPYPPHSPHRSDRTHRTITHSNRPPPSHHGRPRHPPPSSPGIREDRSASSDSASPSPSPNPPALHVRKRKAKASKPAPLTPGAVSFVNYTPSDSRKILTGVAPSGSSKTKARRAKEALDERRKLSQAALRAVRAAGGDVDCLLEQGLLV